MKKTIQKIVVLIVTLAAVATLIFLAAGNYIQCNNKYNHGTHENCGGRWVVTTQTKTQGTFYTCDKCHAQFNSWFGAVFH